MKGDGSDITVHRGLGGDDFADRRSVAASSKGSISSKIMAKFSMQRMKSNPADRRSLLSNDRDVEDPSGSTDSDGDLEMYSPATVHSEEETTRMWQERPMVEEVPAELEPMIEDEC